MSADAGAGDNSAEGQDYPGSDSPLTMWRIKGADPPSAVFSLTGNHTPVSIKGLCPITKAGVPNLKSQAVLAIGKFIFCEPPRHCWHLGCILPRVQAISLRTGAVACFDYIDPDLGGILSQPGIDPARSAGYDADLMHWKGMDPYFNRQRYGVNDTAFIMASTDGVRRTTAAACCMLAAD